MRSCQQRTILSCVPISREVPVVWEFLVVREFPTKPRFTSADTVCESLAVTRLVSAFPLRIVSPFVPTRHFGRTVYYAMASTKFTARFATTCALEYPGLSLDHLALTLGLTPHAVSDAIQHAEPEALVPRISSFRLGKAVWGNYVVRTWALDILVPLLASAPLLTVPVLVGLLFFTAAMYLFFKTSATM